MQGQSDATKAFLSELAGRFQLSENAVAAMLVAVKRGHGTMAQFDIAELGGHGQWMRGGMTMVGDMFNHGLKNTVDNLCNSLAEALSSGRIEVAGASTGQHAWWPQWLGVPSSTGAQNDSAYAVFPSQHCLAIKDGDGVTLYDTEDHLISGVGQQQGVGGSQTFTSQRGSFSVSSLRRLNNGGDLPGAEPMPDQATSHAGAGYTAAPISSTPISSTPAYQPDAAASGYAAESWSAAQSAPLAAIDPAKTSLEERLVDAAEARPQAPGPSSSSDGLQIIALIEKLAALKTAGILSEEEFSAKKAELLKRL
ncbi:putative oligomerization/nucleic acid binding protein [Rhizobium sp. PP-F2F-G48]|uniref:SHOCT domain-containing protein n=1 Tax=Rhizobium sp. PP-F2F-G48 TaxID=2135651 RepID=UPI0010459C19|nr:SHOCT domain-containing protein [Rhizobium sp. PP-F2F-G48]TCM58685.1 putative oligomerization/nucleic acid binding protein [Rhizobium sp. PP-F2F-G48]